MTSSPRQSCTATTAAGTPCRAAARPGREFCAFHDPQLAEKRASARREGGRRRSRPAAVLASEADLPVATVADVTALLGKTINDCRTGRLDAKVASTVAYIASVLLRSLQDGEIEQRLAELERRLASVRKTG